MIINAEQLKRMCELKKVEFVGGPRDGQTLKPFEVDHVLTTYAFWWVDNNSLHFYLIGEKDDRYVLNHVIGDVDVLIDLVVKNFGEVPPDLKLAVPFLKSIEKGIESGKGYLFTEVQQ